MLHPSYRTILAPGEDLFVTQKSRFIGAVHPCSTEEEAVAFLAQRKKQYADARHHVFAYTLHTARALRCSDDGEPQGTAGHPILDFLVQEQLWDLCVVVTRYFGGILLGTGGLVRAYTHAAKIAVETQHIYTMRWCVQCSLTLDYPIYGKITHLLSEKDLLVTGSEFGEMVTLYLEVPQAEVSPLTAALRELSGGTLTPSVTGEGYAPLCSNVR